MNRPSVRLNSLDLAGTSQVSIGYEDGMESRPCYESGRPFVAPWSYQNTMTGPSVCLDSLDLAGMCQVTIGYENGAEISPYYGHSHPPMGPWPHQNTELNYNTPLSSPVPIAPPLSINDLHPSSQVQEEGRLSPPRFELSKAPPLLLSNEEYSANISTWHPTSQKSPQAARRFQQASETTSITRRRNSTPKMARYDLSGAAYRVQKRTRSQQRSQGGHAKIGKEPACSRWAPTQEMVNTRTKSTPLYKIWENSSSDPTKLHTFIGGLFRYSPQYIGEELKRMLEVDDDSGYQSRSTHHNRAHEATKKYESQQKIAPRRGKAGKRANKSTEEKEAVFSGKWTCTNCGDIFDKKSLWMKHESIHWPQQVWICPECPRTSATRRDHFQTHLKTHVSGKFTNEQYNDNCHAVASRFPRECNFRNCTKLFHTWKERMEHLAKHMKNPYNPWDIENSVDEISDCGEHEFEDSESDKSEASDRDMGNADEPNSDDDDDSEDDSGGPDGGGSGHFASSGTTQGPSNQKFGGPQSGSQNTGRGNSSYQYGNGGCGAAWQNNPLIDLTDLSLNPVSDVLYQGETSYTKAAYTQNLDHDCAEINAIKSELSIPVRWLGSGSTATVSEVEEQGANETLARKVVKYKDLTERKNIDREIDVMRHLRHSHIVDLRRSWSDTSTVTLLIWPAADFSLSYYIRTHSAASPIKRDTHSWFSCLLSGLEYMHGRGIMHGDIKPDNILIFRNRVYYADFGLSHTISDNELTISDGGFMTKQYAAPEVRSGKRGKPSDIWSLGCVFLELVTVLLQRSVKDFYDMRTLKRSRGSRDFSYSANMATVTSWIIGLERLPFPNLQASSISNTLQSCRAMLGADLKQRPTASELMRLFPPRNCCIALELSAVGITSKYGQDSTVGTSAIKHPQTYMAGWLNTINVHSDHLPVSSFSLLLWLSEMSWSEAFLCGFMDTDYMRLDKSESPRLRQIKDRIKRLPGQISHHIQRFKPSKGTADLYNALPVTPFAHTDCWDSLSVIAWIDFSNKKPGWKSAGCLYIWVTQELILGKKRGMKSNQGLAFSSKSVLNNILCRHKRLHFMALEVAPKSIEGRPWAQLLLQRLLTPYRTLSTVRRGHSSLFTGHPEENIGSRTAHEENEKEYSKRNSHITEDSILQSVYASLVRSTSQLITVANNSITQRSQSSALAIPRSANRNGKYSKGSKISRSFMEPRTALSGSTKTPRSDKSMVLGQASYQGDPLACQAVFSRNMEPLANRRIRRLTPEGRAPAALVRKSGPCAYCKEGKRKCLHTLAEVNTSFGNYTGNNDVNGDESPFTWSPGGSTPRTPESSETSVSADTQSRAAEAEAMFHRALEGYEKAFGPEHTSTLHTVNNLALLYYNRGKMAEAEAMFHRALEGYEKAFGPEHTSTLNTVYNLGNFYSDQDKIVEAEAMYRRALEGYEKALGPEHTTTLNTVNNLGNLYRDQGKMAEAEAMFQRALEGKAKTLGLEHTSTLETVLNLALLHITKGANEEAAALLERAVSGFEKTLGPHYRSTLVAAQNLEDQYRREGRIEEADLMSIRYSTV